MKRVVWSLLAVALAAGLCALGAWQLGRAQWKTAHRDALARAAQLTPVGLAAALAAPSEAPLRVEGSGRFDNAATVLLDNEVREGRAGVRVYTLFRPAGTKRSLLVDRGWLALARDDAPAIPPVKGRVKIAGLLRAPPAIGLKLGNAQFVRGAEPPRVAYVDIAALRGQMGADLADAVLEPDSGAPYAVGPARDVASDPMTPERHRGYAVQWFALAAAVLALASYLLWKSRR